VTSTGAVSGVRAARPARPTRGRPPGALGQVAGLIALRVSGLRGADRRRAVVGAAILPGLAVAAVVTGALFPREQARSLILLTPSAWLFFFVGAIVAAATGAGGRQLLPREQAVAFPVSPTADHLGAIVTAPLNLAWSVQAVTLLALTSWTVGPATGLVPALALTLAWIVCCTVVAQAAGWLVEIVRTTPAGVWAVRALIVAVAAGVSAVALTGEVTAALDSAPTQPLVTAGLIAAEGGGLGPWAGWLAALTGATVVGWLAGARLVGVLARRPALVQQRGETRRWRRRPPARGTLRANLRIDHAAVWRSAPLRRGIVALGIIPGAAAAATGLAWPMVALLPGLVASGAGLLFGVNAFALDGPGALWRETLPGPPRTMLAARLLVIAEVCLAGALVALVAAGVRAGRPAPAEVVVVVAALVATTAQVVARCARWSMERPYAAALREARDQPAPPAAMAGYSARLAVSTTGTGLLYTFLALNGLATTAVLLTCAFALVAVRRIAMVAQRWTDHTARTQVLATVAGARA
jgi:hypothetical protein